MQKECARSIPGYQFTAVLLLLLFLCAGCTTQLAKNYEEQHHIARALDEMRVEIGDLKHMLNATQTELSILEEKLHASGKAETKNNDLREQISSLQRKILHLEQTQDRIIADLKQVSSQANQTTLSLSQYREKIQELQNDLSEQASRSDEVAKLKTTLSSISKAISTPAPLSPALHIYRVKPGESLERIARREKVSVEEIKKLNGLHDDRIFSGQELKLP